MGSGLEIIHGSGCHRLPVQNWGVETSRPTCIVLVALRKLRSRCDFVKSQVLIPKEWIQRRLFVWYSESHLTVNGLLFHHDVHPSCLLVTITMPAYWFDQLRNACSLWSLPLRRVTMNLLRRHEKIEFSPDFQAVGKSRCPAGRILKTQHRRGGRRREGDCALLKIKHKVVYFGWPDWWNE